MAMVLVAAIMVEAESAVSASVAAAEITATSPQCGGVGEVNVPPHEFGERRFGTARGVIAQKLLVGKIVRSQDSNCGRENRKGMCCGSIIYSEQPNHRYC
jgi:hypothetical protein